jgi:hypothetical protein
LDPLSSASNTFKGITWNNLLFLLRYQLINTYIFLENDEILKKKLHMKGSNSEPNPGQWITSPTRTIRPQIVFYQDPK